ncbi:MAG TPA: hypothetical protein DCF91_01880 [Porphyromonadaceae bacterium]|nr:hypothetical protein [Porphyromonadaceae bacterium]
MNKKSYIKIGLVAVIFTLAALMVWFGRENKTAIALQQVDSLIISHPAEALHELGHLKEMKMSQKDRAYYNLLVTQASILNGQIPANDSLINVSLLYFLNGSDSAITSRALFLRGRILHKASHSLEAVSSYMHANEYFPQGESLQLKHDILVSLADVYRYNKLYEEEQKTRSEALISSRLLADSSRIANDLIGLAYLFTTRRQYPDSSLLLLHEALDYTTFGNRQTLAAIYKNMASAYSLIGEEDSAMSYIDKSIALKPDKAELSAFYLLKARALLKRKNYAEAEKYYQLVSDSSDITARLQQNLGMYRINSATHQANKALQNVENMIVLQDSMNRGERDETTERMQSIQAYKKQREQYIKDKFEIYRTRTLTYKISTVFLLVGVFMLLILMFYRNRKIKLESSVREKKIKLAELELERQSMENQLLREQTEKEQLLARDMIMKAEYYKRLNMISIPILSAPKDKQGFIFLGKKEWDVIENNTNACFDHFTKRLREKYPQMSDEEIRFCCLIKMELPLDLLSAIYHIEKNSISKRKGRLRDKLGVTDQTLDDYIKHF